MKVIYLVIVWYAVIFPVNSFGRCSLRDATELQIRDGLPNFSNKIENGNDQADSIVTIYPLEYSRPLRNPLKGFTNRTMGENNEWATLMHSYIKWNEIERDSSDGIEQIIKCCNEKWEGVEDRNIKVIPRVYLHWSGDKTYWPSDLETYDYTSTAFKLRLSKMIEKLGKCWNNDPRIAHIEMGIIGKWGEHHSPSPSPEIENLLGEEFRKAFTNKKVTVRHPWEFESFKFGIYWDSWAHYDEMNLHGQGIFDLGDRWKTEVIGGETAYNWGNYLIQPGSDPTNTMEEPYHRNFLIKTIRWLHCTQLEWCAAYDPNVEAAKTGAEEVQKVFGYRFVIDKFSYPSFIEKGKDFTVSFSLRNIGSAPLYCDWPVELSLLDKNNDVIWSSLLKDVDIRTWLPGDNWNNSKYTIPSDTIKIKEKFRIEENVNSGKYKLALAVLDPSGNLPSLRFAIKNYINGGRHPMGYVGIESEIQAIEIDPSYFDDPYDDNTLKYLYDPDFVISSNFVTPKAQLISLKNYPNPFCSSTTIEYQLSESTNVTLKIYTVTGQLLKNFKYEKQSVGCHKVIWNGKDENGNAAFGGIFVCQLISDEGTISKKMNFIR